MQYKVGDRVRTKEDVALPHAGDVGEIVEPADAYDWRIRFDDETTVLYNEDEIEEVVK